MIFKYNKKDIEKLFNNKEFSKILEIYLSCTSIEKANALKTFIENNGYGLKKDEFKNIVTTEIIHNIRENNRKEELKRFVPIEKRISDKSGYLTKEENTFIKESKDVIKKSIDSYKNKIGKETYIFLKQIYDTNKDDNYVGLYNVQFDIDSILENGICYGKEAKFSSKANIIKNFDLMLNKISKCSEEEKSNGVVIIKIPKNALDIKSVPIYYLYDNYIYLNPENVVCYVSVVDEKIVSLEINESMNKIESILYEGDRLEEKKIFRIV